MRLSPPLLALLSVLSVCRAAEPPKELYSPLVSSKVLATAGDRRDGKSYPYTTDSVAGIWAYVKTDWWTSGFFPATLYSIGRRADLCPNTVDHLDWVGLGRVWSADLTSLLVKNSVGHDVGFVSFPFVNELEIHPDNETAVQVVKGFAEILANRFDWTVGCTRSWDSTGTNFQVIIDNMMNLDLFFVASRLTRNNTLVDMAISHADKTIENHIRPDGSSYHVVEYDSSTGLVTKRRTAQGYSDQSTWTRGQAWGMFGFANMYRRTKLDRYLQTARRMSNLFISRTPPSGIVPWDFDAPIDPPRPADVSAANLAAYALLVLSEQEASVNNATGAKYYADAAINLIADTVNFAWRPDWQALFSNGTVNKPSNSYWTGIVYADYYFIQAGNKLLEMGLANCNE